ncbi:MAG: glycosyltransferase family 4 protein [Planctomycetes bacterium]|nr:glycosyltransferase family 4 protein [Planctomycetota bacterium]
MSLLENSPFRTKTLAILRLECFVTGPDGKPVNEGGFVPFVDSLAPYFERVEVAAPLVERLQLSSGLQSFQSPNVSFRALPDLKGLARSWWRSRAALEKIRSWSTDWDLVNLRAPDNLLPFTAPLLAELGVPYYVQLVSHPFDAATSAIGALSAPLRPIGRFAWHVQHRAIARALHGHFCIAHGASLAKIASAAGAEALNLPSGSLRREWVQPRAPRPRPRKLLFVGRLNREKGLEHLIDALPALEDLDLTLSLVGWPTGDFGRELRQRALGLGVLKRLDFRGPAPHGETLFDIYREHDLFVLPSVSEGTPRVIGEAMAFGLPVVTTSAGGLPDLVEVGVTGLMVPPGDSAALAAAIRRMIADDELRQRLVENATRSLDGRTLEAKAEQHVAALAARFDPEDQGVVA